VSADIRRIAAATIAAVVIGLVAAAAPAATATDAPTATQLVKKLVHDGVCKQLQSSTPPGTK
jgi:type IV secretory pathway VirB2 component (pilin)